MAFYCSRLCLARLKHFDNSCGRPGGIRPDRPGQCAPKTPGVRLRHSDSRWVERGGFRFAVFMIAATRFGLSFSVTVEVRSD